ncbi:MAG: diadenylate cyclase CdaA [Alphaproteobacteria bacterium]|nr:diadenylate cyclase CdaA [Alphaproteobacteria bacterium]MBN2675154.1 diadenylate cyclase CdaA [Alphaproteobacteria bacterium]
MFSWIGFIQILIIVAILLFFYKVFIKNTSSEKLVHGLVGLGVLWVSSFVMNWLHFDLLGGFLHWVSLFLSVGLVVIFQPELRKFMALMGNFRGIFSSISLRASIDKDEINKSIDQIVNAVEYMSIKRTGALIVLQDKFDEGAVEKKGTILDAAISSELLLTIFFNKTPLHDGAVIIDNNRILSAGAILPLSQNELKWKYGTRHRAAIGLSESSKSVVLVVSEETGDISIAERGTIKKYEDLKKLKVKLEKLMRK